MARRTTLEQSSFHRLLISIGNTRLRRFAIVNQAQGGTEIVIHFSCDRCKRPIDPHDDLRYAVRIEIRAKMGTDDDLDDEDDRDHLMEIHEILEASEASDDDLIGEDVYQQRRFDLCPECYRKFARNPVGRERNVELNFSQN